MSGLELTGTQKLLYKLMYDHADHDVAIVLMYEALYGEADSYTTVRDMQQKLANIIARINRKLPTNCKIEPGALKRTYRLNTNVVAL